MLKDGDPRRIKPIGSKETLNQARNRTGALKIIKGFQALEIPEFPLTENATSAEQVLLTIAITKKKLN